MKGMDKSDLFSDALTGKNIPVLTLDNKWYRLLSELDKEQIKDIEEELNSLLKRQGKINTESRDIKRLKKKLMSEIMPMVGEGNSQETDLVDKDIEEHKRLIEECNEKLQGFSDELLELPREIDQFNKQLMLQTMTCCYDTIQQNTTEIEEIEAWVKQIRIELKKKLILKQEMEQKNHEIYSYMHDIFGAEVLNMFDIRYNPENKHPRVTNDTN